MNPILASYFFGIVICAMAVAVFRDSPLVSKKRDLYAGLLLYPPLVLIFSHVVFGWVSFMLFLAVTLITNKWLRDASGDVRLHVTAALWFRFLLLEILLPLPALLAGDLFRRAGVDPLPALGVFLYAAMLYVFFIRAPDLNRIK
jgi:hypothetical protein